MRNLNGHDVFMALRVLKRVGVKDELIELATYMNRVADGKAAVTAEKQEKVGARLIFGLLSNAGDEAAEKAVFEFLAGPLETTAEELAQRDLLDICEDVDKYIKSMDRERWSGFFRSLSASLKTTI